MHVTLSYSRDSFFHISLGGQLARVNASFASSMALSTTILKLVALGSRRGSDTAVLFPKKPFQRY